MELNNKNINMTRMENNKFDAINNTNLASEVKNNGFKMDLTKKQQEHDKALRLELFDRK